MSERSDFRCIIIQYFLIIRELIQTTFKRQRECNGFCPSCWLHLTYKVSDICKKIVIRSPIFKISYNTVGWAAGRASGLKIEWRGVVVIICLERDADCLYRPMIQLMPLPSRNPIISCLIYIQTGFTFLVPAYPGCPGKKAVKRV